MAETTEIRRALAAAVSPLELPYQVARGKSLYDETRGAGFDVINFIVRITVGEENDESLELLDGLLDPDGERSVKSLIEESDELEKLTDDFMVSQSSGQQRYQPDGLVGAEWVVKVQKGT